MHVNIERRDKYMNNKGFAIMTIIFGMFVLFMLLLTSFLSMCVICRSNLSKLIDESGEARDIIKKKPITKYSSKEELLKETTIKSGLYCFSNGCEYISKYNIK